MKRFLLYLFSVCLTVILGLNNTVKAEPGDVIAQVNFSWDASWDVEGWTGIYGTGSFPADLGNGITLSTSGGELAMGTSGEPTSTVVPDRVSNTYNWLSNADETPADLILSGLNPGIRYDFLVYASRDDESASDDRTTTYSVLGSFNSGSINPVGNTDKFVDLTGVTPAPDGTATIRMSKLEAQYGYINALIIKESELPPYEGTPFGGTPRTIPGKIQIEDYDEGGQNVAYWDDDDTNNGGYRPDEAVDVHVDIYDTQDGTYQLGWFHDGEWLKYTVNVTEGTYDIIVRVATPNDGTALKVFLEDSLLAYIPIQNTGSYDNMEEQKYESVTIPFSAENKVLKLENVNNDYDFNWIEFRESSGGGTISTTYDTLQSVGTAQVGSANPDVADDYPADLLIHKTANDADSYESFVKFDISSISIENLVSAAVVTWGGQHNPSGQDLLDPYWVDLFGCNTTDWPDPFTWNSTRDMQKSGVLASENVQSQKHGYTFEGALVAEWIKMQKEEGATEVVFRFDTREEYPWNIWLSGTWKGQELILEYGEPVAVADSTERLQSVITGEVNSKNPDSTDENPADLMIWTTVNDTFNCEGFVKFDISNVDAENLVGASVVTYAGQHNPSGQSEINPYMIDMYGCNTTDWPEPFTWNSTRDMHKSSLLASENVKAFSAGYTFGSQFVVDWIKAKIAEGATEAVFRFNARDEQAWDVWLSGTWKGEELVLEYLVPVTIADSVVLQSTNTEEAGAANPDATDSNRADIMVHTTADGADDYEAFVKFDISNIQTENLVDAAVITWGGQHNPDGEERIAEYLVDMYGCNDVDWPDPFTWNSTRGFHKTDDVLATANIQEQKGGYTFGGEAVMEWIKAKKAGGATEVAFRYNAQAIQPWDIWLSGTWKGQELKLYYNTKLTVADKTVVPFSITYYPNPVNDVLILSNLESESIIAVYNIEGRHMQEIRTSDSKIELRMNDYKSGIYIVRVVSDNNIQSFKVIKR